MSSFVLLAGDASVIKYSSFHGVYMPWERHTHTRYYYTVFVIILYNTVTMSPINNKYHKYI